MGVRVGVGLALACGLSLGLAVPASAASAVAISGLAYVPPSLTVTAGTTVTWTNQDSGIPHSVTSDTGVFDSGPTCSPGTPAGCLSTGQSFSHVFATAGTFAYHCHIHGFMHGTITVTSTTPSTTTSTTVPPTTTTAPPTTAPPTTARPVTVPITSPPATTPPAPARVAARTVTSGGLALTGANHVAGLAELAVALIGIGLLLVAGTMRRRSDS